MTFGDNEHSGNISAKKCYPLRSYVNLVYMSVDDNYTVHCCIFVFNIFRTLITTKGRYNELIIFSCIYKLFSITYKRYKIEDRRN